MNVIYIDDNLMFNLILLVTECNLCALIRSRIATEYNAFFYKDSLQDK